MLIIVPNWKVQAAEARLLMLERLFCTSEDIKQTVLSEHFVSSVEYNQTVGLLIVTCAFLLE